MMLVASLRGLMFVRSISLCCAITALLGCEAETSEPEAAVGAVAQALIEV
jgi:hypothetical protein